jgi:hypothetical protein
MKVFVMVHRSEFQGPGSCKVTEQPFDYCPGESFTMADKIY